MRLVITFGPGYEPIDLARRLTNFSTGRLGTGLANHFHRQGWDVHCLRAEATPHPGPLLPKEVEAFSTNDDLADRLQRISRSGPVDAVFQVAALCDFRVARVLDRQGAVVTSPKHATRDGRLTLELEPATKVLPRLREWFPAAVIVGWKYELAGTCAEAFAAAWRQLSACGTDACVLNGAAHGPGFTLCEPGRRTAACATPAALAVALERLVSDPARSATGRFRGPL